MTYTNTLEYELQIHNLPLPEFWVVVNTCRLHDKETRRVIVLLRKRYTPEGKVRQSYAQIGRKLGVTAQRAHSAVRHARKRARHAWTLHTKEKQA